MAEVRMMTPADAIARAMAGEPGELLRDAVAVAFQQVGGAAAVSGVAVGRSYQGTFEMVQRDPTGDLVLAK